MNIEKIKIDDFSFYLECFGDGKGKVTITSCEKDENYSHYWGAMGMDLKSFLKKVDNGSFLGKLMPRKSQETFSAKNTGRNIRKIWREEIMKWYEHLEFQKDFREKLNSFLDGIIDSNHFVYEFDSFIRSLDTHLIDGYYNQKSIEDLMKDILQSECWNLIETEPSIEYKRLSKAFTKLKKQLKTSH